MSKPPNWPSPCTVGMFTTKIFAPLIVPTALPAEAMKSSTDPFRSCHGLSLKKPMPTFSPRPTKLKPEISRKPSYSGSPWVASRTCLNTPRVICSEDPGGSWTMVIA